MSQLESVRRGCVVSISAGFSVAEIREFVVEYQRVPHGQKGPWLAASYSPADGLIFRRPPASTRIC